jgi:hypothetical protein
VKAGLQAVASPGFVLLRSGALAASSFLTPPLIPTHIRLLLSLLSIV